MTANAVVRARIDEHIRDEAAIVLAAMGLTVSDAFRMMLTRVVNDKALPFEVLMNCKQSWMLGKLNRCVVSIKRGSSSVI
jgi:addiction module RelB/DinJ family antitoxin